MNSSTNVRRLVLATSFFVLSISIPADVSGAGVRFQRPGEAREELAPANKHFRRPGVSEDAPPQTVSPEPVREAKPVPKKQASSPRVKPARKSASFAKKELTPRELPVAVAKRPRPKLNVEPTSAIELTGCNCDICDGPCHCEVSCACPEPSCGMYEPGCGICEPSCGCGEPTCGICEPSCGLYEPGCGIAEPGCGCPGPCDGSCCALPGPDYFCFPVCIPRFKDLSLFAGVQGFRGPRDFANQRSDSNFGFNEGINLSGNAPLIGLLFPELSYQLGYRAVQSRLHGTATSINDRSQQFVTAGFFRRVDTGIQFGAVWDLMDDDLDTDIDLHQIRYEISIKSPQGREIGFFGTNSTNDATSLGILWETVDQYAGFIRWRFGNGYESRLWGGATGDGEGLFGGEFHAPLSSRWEVQSGFNYLITDEADGRPGVSQESWNIGINMVWHLGRTAKRGCRSPYRPMFSVADNGWMFVDQAQ